MRLNSFHLCSGKSFWNRQAEIFIFPLSFSLRCELNMDGTEERERVATGDHEAALQVITFKQVRDESREGEIELHLFMRCPQTYGGSDSLG